MTMVFDMGHQKSLTTKLARFFFCPGVLADEKNTRELHCTSILTEKIYIAGACSVGKRQPVKPTSGCLAPSTSRKDTPQALQPVTSSLNN